MLLPAVRDEVGRHRCRENAQVDYDPTQYRGSARYYLAGRPPYSAELGTMLARELGLDGTGHLLDVGCGPGVLAVQLAAVVEQVTAVDPDADMLEQARLYAASSGVQRIDFIRARADLGLAPMRIVTFGQSFHRTDRVPVAEAVYDLLEPGGAIVLVVHDPDGGSAPAGTGDPAIPDDEVQQLVSRYLGAQRQSGLPPRQSIQHGAVREHAGTDTVRTADDDPRALATSHQPRHRRRGLGLPIDVLRRAPSVWRPPRRLHRRPAKPF